MISSFFISLPSFSFCLFNQFNEREDLWFWRLVEDLLPFIRFEFLTQEIFYHKMIIPAIHDLETGQPLAFDSAVGERDRIAESRAPDHEIVSRRRAFFFHRLLPD